MKVYKCDRCGDFVKYPNRLKYGWSSSWLHGMIFFYNKELCDKCYKKFEAFLGV